MRKETDTLLPRPAEDKAVKHPAFQLSNSLRWTTNVLALTSTFFFSGIIFGWAPLELMLLREGQYSSLCNIDSAIEMNDTNYTAFDPSLDMQVTRNSGIPLCSDQTNALAGMFTVGQFFLNFLSFFCGMALDYLPKSVLLTICAVLEIVGLTLLGISETTGDNYRDYFYVSYALLAIGGSATMLSGFPASFLLKKYQAGLLASISCLFDASSIIFSIFKALQDRFGWERKDIFLMYTIWAVIVYTPLVICWIILERRNWQQILQHEDKADEANARNHGLLADTSNSSDQSFASTNPNYVIHVKRIQNMTIFDQLKTADFGFTMFFVATHMFQCNYYVMAVDAFLLSLGDDKAIYATIFSWALPCGIFFVPFIERTVTFLGIVNTLHTTNVLALIFAFNLLVPNLTIQTINFFIFTCFRAYLYATINTLIAGTFGVQTMGRIIGVVFTVAAVIGLAQYPMSVASEVYFQGDYFPMNLLLTIVAILPAIVTFSYGSHVMVALSDDGLQKIQHQNRLPSAISPGLILASPGRELVQSIRRARLLHDGDENDDNSP